MHHRFKHETFGSVRRNAIAGCHLCTLLWVSVYEQEASKKKHQGHRNLDPVIQTQSYDIDTTHIDHEVWGGRQGGDQCFWIQPIVQSSNMHYIRRGDSMKLEIVRTESFTAELSTIQRDELSWWTKSAGVLACIKSQLDNCSRSHEHCKRHTISELPTRLIQVDTLDFRNISLLSTESLGKDTQYATLSYCWGPNVEERICLTAAAEQEFSRNIPHQDIPKTIREAVHLAWALSFSYIWIDSLCIIQDSESDKARNIASMASTYQNSDLTITALAAASADQGLYMQRNPLCYSALPIPDRDGQVRIYLHPPDSAEDRHRSWPSHKRGWIFQERILSRRSINMGPYFVWACEETIKHEFGLDCSQEFELGPRFQRLLKQPVEHREQRWRLYAEWLNILDTYFTTNLGFSTDRLNAISGLIKLVGDHTGWRENIGGFWESFFREQLLWTPVTIYKWPAKSGLNPSWSWISSCDPVKRYPLSSGEFKWLDRHLCTVGVRTPAQVNIRCTELFPVLHIRAYHVGFQRFSRTITQDWKRGQVIVSCDFILITLKLLSQRYLYLLVGMTSKSLGLRLSWKRVSPTNTKE